MGEKTSSNSSSFLCLSKASDCDLLSTGDCERFLFGTNYSALLSFKYTVSAHGFEKNAQFFQF